MPTRIKKPLPWFKTNPQVRSAMKESSKREMADSLKAHGQLQDVAALADGTLIFGHRRLAGAELAGIDHLWVQIYDEPLDGTAFTVMQLIENMDREDLTGYEQWQGCKKLLELNPDWSLKDLAARLRKDPSMVTRLTSPSRCIPAWQDALKSGAVGISDCYAASRATEQQQHELLADKFGGASRDDIDRRVRKTNGRRRRDCSSKLAEAKCELPGGACVVIRMKTPSSAVTLAIIAEFLSDALKRARKGVEEGFDIKTWEAVQRDMAKGA